MAKAYGTAFLPAFAPASGLPVRFIVLLAALIVYAVAGSPTPDHPGWTEALVGCLLVAAAGSPAVTGIFTRPDRQAMLKLLFFYGLTVPLLGGALRGNDAALILRDMLGFLFLCLPLFYVALVRHSPRATRLYIYALIFLGVVFSLRALAPAYGYAPRAQELYYLPNAPTVLFAAILLAGVALRAWGGGGGLPGTARMVLAAAGLAVIVWAMLLDFQRATIFSVAVSIVAILCLLTVRAPRRMIVPALLACLAIWWLFPVLQEGFDALAEKTVRVGFNRRIEEVQAVVALVGADPLTALFGAGWGAKIVSPAVGGIAVPYTHSLLSYMLLKTGLVGLTLCAAWLFGLAGGVVRTVKRDPAMGLALFWPLTIPLFLYASHKSLDFGLIVLLATVLADGRNGLVASAKRPV